MWLLSAVDDEGSELLHLLHFTRKCALKQLHLWHLTHFAPGLQGRHKRSHSCILIVRSYLHPLTITLHVSSNVAAISLFSPLKLPPSRSIRSLKLGSGFPAHIRADATCCSINGERISLTHCGRSEKKLLS